jgi:hypothetical protein
MYLWRQETEERRITNLKGNLHAEKWNETSNNFPLNVLINKYIYKVQPTL